MLRAPVKNMRMDARLGVVLIAGAIVTASCGEPSTLDATAVDGSVAVQASVDAGREIGPGEPNQTESGPNGTDSRPNGTDSEPNVTDSGSSTVPLPALTMLPPSLGPRFAGGIEPGDPSQCEATPPSRCHWVDADAPDGGDGSFASPYNSFEAVVGSINGANYSQGSIAGGDYLYLRGTFMPPSTDDPSHLLRVLFRRASQGGTRENPTVIKSWRGFPRAVFDGQHQTNDMIVFAGMPSFRVANLEIRNANGRGVLVESGKDLAIFEDLVVHDTIGDGVVGVGGGLHFFGDANHELVVRNCHFYANNKNAFGAINNIGALSLTSDLMAPDFGIFRVYHNVFERETTGVRHKHAGSYDTEIYENLFWNSERAIVLRSFRSNEIRNNIFLDLSESAIVSYVENTNGELHAAIHHNDFFNTTRLMTDVIGVHDHGHALNVHHNFYHSTTAATVYAISSAASLPFVTGSSNMYLLPSDTMFSTPTDGSAVAFAAFAASIGDTTSVLHTTTTSGTNLSVHNDAYSKYATERKAGSIGY
jgi:hypothetical protein